MKIVLTGMSGVGKTIVGCELAKCLNFKFIDVDAEIENIQNKTINEIFFKEGESTFRQYEAEITNSIIDRENDIVISIGGGGFENDEIRARLLDNTIVIYLKANPKSIYERVKNTNNRPLLNNNMNINKITELLNTREIHYILAHFTILTDNKSVSEIVDEIFGVLKNECSNS